MDWVTLIKGGTTAFLWSYKVSWAVLRAGTVTVRQSPVPVILMLKDSSIL